MFSFFLFRTACLTVCDKMIQIKSRQTITNGTLQRRADESNLNSRKIEKQASSQYFNSGPILRNKNIDYYSKHFTKRSFSQKSFQQVYKALGLYT